LVLRLHFSSIVGNLYIYPWKIGFPLKALIRDSFLLLLVLSQNLCHSHVVVAPVLVVLLRSLQLLERRRDVDSIAFGHVLDDLVPAVTLVRGQDILVLLCHWLVSRLLRDEW